MLDFLTFALCAPYSETTDGTYFDTLLEMVANDGRAIFKLFQVCCFNNKIVLHCQHFSHFTPWINLQLVLIYGTSYRHCFIVATLQSDVLLDVLKVLCSL